MSKPKFLPAVICKACLTVTDADGASQTAVLSIAIELAARVALLDGASKSYAD